MTTPEELGRDRAERVTCRAVVEKIYDDINKRYGSDVKPPK